MANISNSKDPANYLAIIVAAVIVETILLVNYTLFSNYWGNIINYVYTEYTITVVIIDILSLLMSFSLSQQIYEYFYGNTRWNILLFILILFSYQMIRNILFYYILPQIREVQSSNYIINSKILLGNLLVSVLLPVIASLMKSIYISYQFDLIILGSYIICYILLNYY